MKDLFRYPCFAYSERKENFMKKLRSIILLVVVFIITTGFTYTQDKQRVFDYSGLLMTSEVEDAEEILKSQSIEDKVDYAFVSTNDLQGYNAKEYMKLFMSTKQMGYDKVGGDSAILLVDLQNREVWVGTGGTLSDLFQDMDISSIVSDILPYTQKNNFEGAIQVFAHNIHSKLESKTTNRSAMNYGNESKQDGYSDEDNDVRNLKTSQKDNAEYEKERDGLFSNPLTCLLIGAVLSGIVVFTMIQSGKSSMQVGADTYTTEARVNPYTKQDIFIRTVTQKTRKEKQKKE